MNLIEQLKKHEGTSKRGERHIPYRCSEDKLTAAYGRNLDANGIREDEAELMLRNDIEEAADQLRTALPWTMAMGTVRRDVFINMIFNMGIGKFLGFEKTIAFAKTGDYVAVSVEMLDSTWARQVGYRATELSEQMKTGAYHG